ncbi:MAG: hypothetical protein PHQ28_07845 [Mycobacterium sp.]|nr:hypothetical protein [Mycobacterium sp.]
MGGDFRRGQSQLLKPGLICLGDIACPTCLTGEQVPDLEMIALHVYGATDIALFGALLGALFGILEPDRRAATSADAGARFLERVG